MSVLNQGAFWGFKDDGNLAPHSQSSALLLNYGINLFMWEQTLEQKGLGSEDSIF